MSAINASRSSRRDFVRRLLTAGTSIALAPVASCVLAQTGEKVEEGEAAAVGLGYRWDATQVDTKAYPKRAGAQGARQFCENCALFEGEAGDRWAPCSIFQGRLVSGKGWCNAWVSRS
jgi:hypothetical protein